MSTETVPNTPYGIVRNGRYFYDKRVPVAVVGAFIAKFKRKAGAIRLACAGRIEGKRSARRRSLDRYEEPFMEALFG